MYSNGVMLLMKLFTVCLLFQVKCECYWPEKVGEEKKLENGFSVLLCDNVIFADYTIRNITVTKVLQLV